MSPKGATFHLIFWLYSIPRFPTKFGSRIGFANYLLINAHYKVVSELVQLSNNTSKDNVDFVLKSKKAKPWIQNCMLQSSKCTTHNHCGTQGHASNLFFFFLSLKLLNGYIWLCVCYDELIFIKYLKVYLVIVYKYN